MTAKHTTEHHEQGQTMQERHPVPAAEMVRIPGLYRRWELPEVLKNHQPYRIEDAGAHHDGTPLVAVYADAASESQDAVTNAARMDAGSVPPGTISRRPE